MRSMEVNSRLNFWIQFPCQKIFWNGAIVLCRNYKFKEFSELIISIKLIKSQKIMSEWGRNFSLGWVKVALKFSQTVCNGIKLEINHPNWFLAKFALFMLTNIIFTNIEGDLDFNICKIFRRMDTFVIRVKYAYIWWYVSK